ncbi:MAG TPA: porin [Steroidobacteraceae bacterium]|nr:porin [Steroidobacteraceae bacterium]
MPHTPHGWRHGILLAALLTPWAAHAQAPEPTIQELLRRIEEQDQKIRVLERKLEIQEESARAAKETTPVAKAGPAGFGLASAGGQDSITLHGTLLADGRFFASADPTGLTNTWQLTQVRPIVEGTVGEIFDFRFVPDFGQGKTVIQDAYVSARVLPQAAITVGKFKAPVSLERLQQDIDTRFLFRAFPTSLAPNRDLGAQLAGTVLDHRLSYAVAWTNGVNDGSSTDAFGDTDTNNGKEWAGRLFALPFGDSDVFVLRGLGLGVAGTAGRFDGTNAQPLVPTYKTPAQSTFFVYRGGTATPTLANGERVRVAPQLYYYVGNFGLLGEYTAESQDVARRINATTRREATLDTSAWQLAAYWFITGEEETYKGFKPNQPLSLANHTWGAFELVARYQSLLTDAAAFSGGSSSFADPNVSARRATAAGIGLNWYFNENVKWMLDYEQTRFEGGAPGGADRHDEKVFLTRLGLGF